MLLAPTANAMRHMLKICDIYASDYSTVFNASKSKCIFVQSCAISLRPLVLNQSFFIGGNFNRIRKAMASFRSYCMTL